MYEKINRKKINIYLAFSVDSIDISFEIQLKINCHLNTAGIHIFSFIMQQNVTFKRHCRFYGNNKEK